MRRGINHKLNDATPKSVQDFYPLFIKNSASFKELLNWDSAKYKNDLFHYQEQLLDNKHVDIGKYLNTLLPEITNNRYSAQRLLKGFCRHEKAKLFVTQDDTIIFNALKQIIYSTKLKYLIPLAFQSSERSFQKFITDILINEDPDFLEIGGPLLYQYGWELSKQDESMLKKFKYFFNQLIKEKKTYLIDYLEQQGFAETKTQLKALYGQIIEKIEQPKSVRDYLNPLFLFILNNPRYIDLGEKTLTVFAELVFYIAMGDEKDNKAMDEFSLNDVFEFASDKLNKSKLEELRDLYKLLPYSYSNVGNRLNYAVNAMVHADNVQGYVIQQFLSGDLTNDTKSKLCCILAKNRKLHAVKFMHDWGAELSKYNSGFKAYFKTLKHPDLELNENINILYYISASLLNDNELKEEDKSAIMALLFQIFSSNETHEVADYEFKCNAIVQSVKHLTKFYEKEKYSPYKNLVLKYLKEGLCNYSQDTIAQRLENVDLVVQNSTNYHLSYIDTILEQNSKTGRQEIEMIFNKVFQRMERQTLMEWASSSNELGHTLCFLYSYYKYSQNNFDTDFKELNNSHLEFDDLMIARDQIKAEMQNNKSVFEKIDIKYFQHNQVGALALVEHHLEQVKEQVAQRRKPGNLFMQVGTGQGKSLIIAETARRIINSGEAKQVFIVTCYDHLAQRDYNKFASYYQSFGIKAMHCSNKQNSSQLKEQQVIYADLLTYFKLMRSESRNILTKDKQSIAYLDGKNTALILDEFDSLVLDAKEITQYLESFNSKPFPTKSDDEEELRKGMSMLFDLKFIEDCDAKLGGIYTQWLNREIRLYLDEQKENNTDRNLQQNSLGQNFSYGKSFIGSLKNKRCARFAHNYLDPLSFYQQFKFIIGFSGSISRENTKLFEKYCDPMSYYEIPPFFGIAKLSQNRIIREKQIHENKTHFLDAILKEVKLRIKEQPVLIFADSLVKTNEKRSDFDLLKERLEAEFSSKGTNDSLYRLSFVESEEQVKAQLASIGRAGQITLATRILARGADIKVDKNIPKGLHLVITDYPTHESVYLQMLGRTARQDEPGSYSVIVAKKENFQKVSEVSIAPGAAELHRTTQGFFSRVNGTNKSIKKDLRWPLLCDMLCTYPHKLKEPVFQEAVDKVIDEHFFKP